MANTMTAPYPPTASATVTATAAEAGPAKVIYVAPAEDSDTCECTAGWWMFGLGWWLCLPWAVGAALPFCSKGKRPNVRRNNMRAAIGSAVMLLLSIIAIVVVVVVVTRPGGTTTVTTTRWTSGGGGGGAPATVNMGMMGSNSAAPPTVTAQDLKPMLGGFTSQMGSSGLSGFTAGGFGN